MAGSWRPTKRLPAKPGGVLGNSSTSLKCRGHRSRGLRGQRCGSQLPGPQGCWAGSPAQPRPGHPHNAPAPRPPSGRGEAAGEAGALRPPEGAWARAQPSRWLGRRPGGPSPAPQPDTGESGTASSPFPEEALSEAGFPACTPTSGSVHSWGRPHALLLQTGGFPPSLPPPRRHFLPPSPFLGGFPKQRWAPGRPGTRVVNLQATRSTILQPTPVSATEGPLNTCRDRPPPDRDSARRRLSATHAPDVEPAARRGSGLLEVSEPARGGALGHRHTLRSGPEHAPAIVPKTRPRPGPRCLTDTVGSSGLSSPGKLQKGGDAGSTRKRLRNFLKTVQINKTINHAEGL